MPGQRLVHLPLHLTVDINNCFKLFKCVWSLDRSDRYFLGRHTFPAEKLQKVENRSSKWAPLVLYGNRVHSLPQYWKGYFILKQKSSLYRKIAIFFGVTHSSGWKSLEIVNIRTSSGRSCLYTGLEWMSHLYTGKSIWFWCKHQVSTVKQPYF